MRTRQKLFKALTSHFHQPPSAGSFKQGLKEPDLSLEKNLTLPPISSKNWDLAGAIIKAQVTLPWSQLY